ncbi:uncharacterized protein SOCEGT47_003320 [Sorangium cellulosum]|uniref:SMODS-associated and fused to various effectors domain-containing protein n=1 Tax=Sorangium cellulosum TaxID=56 RepID=A0A4P2PTC6_SORCE|nr:hypothetical protein [Sorangium cellulosum]AUX19879.1 uncharacterized protein SOCEGT47_003320 [Sorangium cellulosum]
MANSELHILIVVDLYPAVSAAELRETLPHEREDRRTLVLTEFGAPRLAPPPDASPIDWPGVGRAVEMLVAEVRAIRGDRPTVLFIGGRGPLAVFVHLGYLLSKFGGRQVVINQPPGGGRWEHFPMETAAGDGPALLDVLAGLPAEEVPSSGRVGIYVDTAGRDTSRDVFRDFIKEEGDHVAGVVKLRSSAPLRLTPEHVPALVLQLTQFFSQAPTRYPDRSGLSLFVGGPAQVAFAVGRAVNPWVVGKDIWLTEYRAPSYERVYSLPFNPRTEPEIPRGAEDVNARRDVLDAMAAAIDELKRHMKAEHLPADVLSASDRKKFIDRLARLERSTDSKKDSAFRLRVIEGHYALGEGIAEALRRSTVPEQQGFAKLLILHELLHDWQALRSTNYSAVGGAGFVLEQVDYAADAFAVRALMKMELDRGGDAARDEVRARLERWLDMVLRGIAAFDIMAQGATKMARLDERRLRRYLMWHLQLARAATIREPSHVDEMLRPPLTVELAPLAGRLDTERYEKVVNRALPDTELFCAIGGRLVRQARRPGFDPGALVEAVKSYARELIQQAMVFLVDEHRGKLAPWIA